jgi:tripartite-type tricarboxylate transporter receptor subunit TctC
MYGVWAPARTPVAIVNRMNAEIVRALQKPEFAASISKQGVEPARAHTPADMAAYINAQLPKWAEVVKASGARAD